MKKGLRLDTELEVIRTLRDPLKFLRDRTYFKEQLAICLWLFLPFWK